MDGLAKSLLHKARDEFAARNFAAAAQLFRDALAEEPGSSEALLGLGLCAIEERSLCEAQVFLEQSIHADPSAPWPLIHSGELALRQGDPGRAKTLAERAIGLSETQSQARVLLGKALRATSQPDQARLIFEETIETTPDQIWAWLQLVDMAHDGGNPVAARDLCQRMLAANPGSTVAQLALAESERNLGEETRALAIFQQVVDHDSRNLWGWIHIGAILLERQELAQAAAASAKALEIDAGNSHAQFLAGRCAAALGNAERAAELFRAAAEADPANIWPRLSLADVLAARGDREGALAPLDGVAGEPIVAARVAKLRMSMGQAGLAKQVLEQAIAQSPQSLELWLELAELHWRSGDGAAASAALAHSRRLAPTSSRPLEIMASQAREAQRYEESAQLSREALSINPSSRWARIGLAHTLLNMGEVDQVFDLLDEVADEAEAAPLRLVALRLLGYWPKALRVARETPPARGGGFWHIAERFMVELRMAGPAAAEAFLLRQPRPVDPGEASHRLHLLALSAEEAWQLAKADQLYREAVALDHNRTELLHDAARHALLHVEPDRARDLLGRMVGHDAAAAQFGGRSSNPSQTHLGQLIDEFTLDQATLVQLQALRRLPAGQRTVSLRDLVKANPDSTLAAIQLLIALREAGRFAERPVGPSAIPRRLGQYWSDPDPPEDILGMMDSWAEHHPGCEVQRFHRATAYDFLLRHFGPQMANTFRAAGSETMRADLFRLGWLAAEGGVYADADDRCHGAIDGLLPRGAGFVGYLEDYGTIGNNIMAAVPGHPVIKQALEWAAEAIARRDSDLLWLSTGPGLLSRSVALAVAGSGDLARAHAGIFVLDRAEIHRCAAMHVLAKYKATTRHWSRSSFGRRREVVRGGTVVIAATAPD